MALSLTVGRNTFKICHKEGARTTVWDVSSEDPEEKLIQTFKDVISFVEGAPEKPAKTLFRTVAEAAGIPPGALAPHPGNGWANVGQVMHGAPEIPEGADYELIPPEER
jgi:hypothetical protein